MFPEIKPECWRCHNSLGTWLHIWWTCPKVKKFWEDVYYSILTCINIPLMFTPENCLLHLFTNLGKNETILLNNLLLAAKLLIAKHWKSWSIPTLHKWQIKCQCTLLMHKLIAIKSSQNGSIYAIYNFHSVWSPYILYWNKIKPHYNFGQKLLEFW